MEKILIIGAGYEQIAAIQVAKELGYYVVCNDVNPHAPGLPFADRYYVSDITDVDATRDIIIREKIDGIATVASELAVPVIGKLCEAFGFPGHTYEMAVNATNKASMHTCMELHGVRMAPYAVLSSYEELEEFTNKHPGPWVFKPTDSSGQRGMSLIHKKSEIYTAFATAARISRDRRVIIESFITGIEINVCGVVINGETHILSLGDRIKDKNESFGIAIQHLSPPAIGLKEQEEVAALAKAAVKALGIQTGIIYPQIIAGPDGPVLIEIAIRMPGGHNREVAMHRSGVDMARAAVQLAMNKVSRIDELITEKLYPAITARFITRLDFPGDQEEFSGFSNEESVKNMPDILQYYSHLQRGDKMPELASSGARFAAVIAAGDSREDVLDKAEQAVNLLLNNKRRNVI